MQRTIPMGAEVELGVFADQSGLDVFGVGENRTPRFASDVAPAVRSESG